jgi:hypothetical protein
LKEIKKMGTIGKKLKKYMKPGTKLEKAKE